MSLEKPLLEAYPYGKHYIYTTTSQQHEFKSGSEGTFLLLFSSCFSHYFISLRILVITWLYNLYIIMYVTNKKIFYSILFILSCPLKVETRPKSCRISTVGPVASRHSCKTRPKHAFTGLRHTIQVPPVRDE